MFRKILFYIVLSVMISITLISKEYKITGKIVTGDSNNVPIKNVFVKLLNTPYSTITDSLGKFSIISNSDDVVLKLIKYPYNEVIHRVTDFKDFQTIVMKSRFQIRNTEYIKSDARDRGSDDRARMVGGESSYAEIETGSFAAEYGEVINDPLMPTEKSSAEKSFTYKSTSDKTAVSAVSKSAISDSKTASVMPVSTGNVNLKAGQLTAGEVNDFSKWQLWKDMTETELNQHKEEWNIYPVDRYTLQLENQNGFPVIGAKISLYNGQVCVWNSITDNTGKAELWNNPYFDNKNDEQKYLIVELDGKTFNFNNPKKFNEGINFFKVNRNCHTLKKVDVSFIIDATGSMGDEINYLKTELNDVMQRAKDSLNLDLNLGIVLYKDKTDEYLFEYSDFTNNLSKSIDFLKESSFGGGGDFPEAVDIALDFSLNSLKWRDSSYAKIAFLLLDAPPHQDQESKLNIQLLVQEYSRRGIRLVPIVCSGIDKTTEYLMRSMALLTNGTYLFLTDDSGIGDKHIKPSTDNWNVEYLNDLVYKVIFQFTDVSSCSLKGNNLDTDTMLVVDPSKTGILPVDETLKSNELSLNDSILVNKNLDENANGISWKYYPNPCRDILKIEIKSNLNELFITDISGKLLIRISNTNQSIYEINMSEFPSGLYFIRYEYAPNKWLSGRFLLIK